MRRHRAPAHDALRRQRKPVVEQALRDAAPGRCNSSAAFSVSRGMFPVNNFRTTGLSPACWAVALAGCRRSRTSTSSTTAARGRARRLEVPPDLTQLARHALRARWRAVSASKHSGCGRHARRRATATTVARRRSATCASSAGQPALAGHPLTPEQLWPRLQAFWFQRLRAGDQSRHRASWRPTGTRTAPSCRRTRCAAPSAGVRFALLHRRARQVPHPRGTHRQGQRGLHQPSRRRGGLRQPAEGFDGLAAARGDPQLEAAFLSRLMQKLGVAEEAAKTAVANVPAAPTRARMVAGQVSTLQVDDNFDRAWRRVGLALDRGGFTVEDRDRAQGLYFVRYVDPKDVGKGEPGFFAKAVRQDRRRRRPAALPRAGQGRRRSQHGGRAQRPGRPRRARTASASSAPAARRPEVSRRRADALLQPRQRQRRQRDGGRGPRRAASIRVVIDCGFAARVRDAAGARPFCSRRARRGIRHPRAW